MIYYAYRLTGFYMRISQTIDITRNMGLRMVKVNLVTGTFFFKKLSYLIHMFETN